MPKFFCDYCDVYLTHDSMSVRKAHNSGRNHLRNVIDYYQQIGHEKAQSVIDSITSSYADAGQASSNPMLQTPNLGPNPGGFPGGPPPGFPPFGRGGMPPPFGMNGPPPRPPNLPPNMPWPPPNLPFPPPNMGAMPFPPPGGAGSPPQGMPFPPPGGMPGMPFPFPPNGQAPGGPGGFGPPR